MVVERNVVLPVGTLFIIAAVFCVMIRTDGISNSVVCSNEMQIQPSWRKRILFSGWKKGKKERICISIMVTSKRNMQASPPGDDGNTSVFFLKETDTNVRLLRRVSYDAIALFGEIVKSYFEG